jgi:hypothetical protein
VWTAIDPVSKLLMAIDVGERTLAMAQRVVHQVAQGLAPDSLPLFLTDGHKDYLPAILGHFGHWVQRERRQSKGPVPKPRWMPWPGLLYKPRHDRLCWLTPRRTIAHQSFLPQNATETIYVVKKYGESPTPEAPTPETGRRLHEACGT